MTRQQQLDEQKPKPKPMSIISPLVFHYLTFCIYTLAKKELYVKLIYCNDLNKNVEYRYLRITKVRFNKNKNNAAFITFS